MAHHVPLQFTPETFTGVSLASLVDELLASSEVQQEGKTGRTLAKSEHLTVVLTVMRAGERVREQSVPAPTLVVPIRGDLSFERAGESPHVSSEADSLLLMGPGVQHEIVANTDSAFLWVLGALEEGHPLPL
jgi:quercetin dioxygenase-like cupin family protein